MMSYHILIKSNFTLNPFRLNILKQVKLHNKLEMFQLIAQKELSVSSLLQHEPQVI